MEKEANLEEASQSLAASLQEVNAGLQEIASGSQILSSKINSVVQSANDSAVKIKEVNQVIRAIADVSAHSNLLGLNAAIEAARAGEQGKGFAVVAEEMRTLARQSKDSAKMVTEILTQMKDSIESIIWEVDQIGGIAGNQAASTQEITAALEEISENSQTLVEHAKIKIENR
ncbi:methyl-accepting chemotaxis protein [Desulfitobacterium hafniense]